MSQWSKLRTTMKSIFLSKKATSDGSSSSQSRASNPNSYRYIDNEPSFYYFSLLPAELQVQIWTYAAEPPPAPAAISSTETHFSIVTSHRRDPRFSSESTAAAPFPYSRSSVTATDPAAEPEEPTVNTPSTFSASSLSPFLSLANPPPYSPTKLFFPIQPLMHACSLSRHIFKKMWEPRLPEYLRGVIARTGKWVLLTTRVLENQGQGILVTEERVSWAAAANYLQGRPDRSEGVMVTYYLVSFAEEG